MSDSSSSSGASSLFAFDLASDTEQPEAYVSGGFLPVDVGDLLGPQADSSLRYRVLGKLGHGAYSTVWLARDNVAKTMVAVKTLRASESTNSRELTILQRLRNSSPDSSAVVQILDAFTAQSPNGIHQILVTELVIPLRELLEMIRLVRGTVNAFSIVSQLLQGVTFIHERGVVHGDLHPNNIGARLRDLDHLTEKEFWKQSGSPSVVPMISMDSERDPGSFPANLTRGIQLGRILERVEPASLQREIQICIFDLGCGRIVEDTACPRWHTPLPYVAPELAFPMLVENNRDAFWDWPVDIWSLACTIWQLLAQQPLFSWNKNCLLHGMARLCGPAPSTWVAYLEETAPPTHSCEYKHDGQSAWERKVKWLHDRGQPVEVSRAVVALLRRMLSLETSNRPRALDLLDDPQLLKMRGSELTARP